MAIAVNQGRRHVVADWLWVCRWVVSLLRARMRGPIDGAAAGRRVRALAEHFGGLWVKLGQLVSLRIDVFGEAFCAELGRLQDSGTGLPADIVIAIIERELQAPLDSVFVWFDPVPMAAASIGQVHRARLRTGETVAVKVQRPDIDRRVHRQLARLDRIAAIVERLGVLPQLAWRHFAWELREVMREELDYRYEAANTRRMRRRLRRHGLHVPRVFASHSTAQVLTTELIDGVTMVEFIAVMALDPDRAKAWLATNRIDPHRVAGRLTMSLLRQILEENLFHGDLHPGNILLLADSQVALIDFGTVSSTDRAYLEKFRAMTFALAGGDFAKVADLTLLMCQALPPMDTRPVIDDLVQVIQAWTSRTWVRDLPFHQKSLNNVYGEVSRVLLRHQCVFEWAFLRIRRAQETLDASMLMLYPEANPTALARRYFKAARRRAASRVSARPARRVAAAITRADRGVADLAERAIFELDVIRRRALTFEAHSTRIAAVAATLTGAVALGGAAAATVVFLSWFAAAPTAVPLLGGADQQVRGLLLLSLTGFTWSTWRLWDRLRRPSLPGSGASAAR